MFHAEIPDVEGLMVENTEVEPQVTDASPVEESRGSCQEPDQDEEQAGIKPLLCGGPTIYEQNIVAPNHHDYLCIF